MTSTAWNLANLRRYIANSYPENCGLMQRAHSLDRSSRIFEYHVNSADAAMNGAIEGDGGLTTTKAFLSLFGRSTENHKYQRAKIINEAHLIASLHTTRGMIDIFAQLLNELVCAAALKPELCDISKVAPLVPPGRLQDRLDALLKSHWYRYVSAFINTTKHRHLVDHSTAISFLENRAEIKIGAFKYRRHSFPAYRDKEVLQGVIEVNNAVVECGKLLNEQLGI